MNSDCCTAVCEILRRICFVPPSWLNYWLTSHHLCWITCSVTWFIPVMTVMMQKYMLGRNCLTEGTGTWTVSCGYKETDFPCRRTTCNVGSYKHYRELMLIVLWLLRVKIRVSKVICKCEFEPKEMHTMWKKIRWEVQVWWCTRGTQ